MVLSQSPLAVIENNNCTFSHQRAFVKAKMKSRRLGSCSAMNVQWFLDWASVVALGGTSLGLFLRGGGLLSVLPLRGSGVDAGTNAISHRGTHKPRGLSSPETLPRHRTHSIPTSPNTSISHKCVSIPLLWHDRLNPLDNCHIWGGH